MHARSAKKTSLPHHWLTKDEIVRNTLARSVKKISPFLPLLPQPSITNDETVVLAVGTPLTHLKRITIQEKTAGSQKADPSQEIMRSTQSMYPKHSIQLVGPLEEGPVVALESTVLELRALIISQERSLMIAAYQVSLTLGTAPQNLASNLEVGLDLPAPLKASAIHQAVAPLEDNSPQALDQCPVLLGIIRRLFLSCLQA